MGRPVYFREEKLEDISVHKNRRREEWSLGKIKRGQGNNLCNEHIVFRVSIAFLIQTKS